MFGVVVFGVGLYLFHGNLPRSLHHPSNEQASKECEESKRILPKTASNSENNLVASNHLEESKYSRSSNNVFIFYIPKIFPTSQKKTAKSTNQSMHRIKRTIDSGH